MLTAGSLGTELRWGVSDSMVMAWRNVMRYARSPDLLVFSTVQPVMFVLLFTYVFGGAISGGAGNYIDFLLPGILMQTVLFGSTQTGIGLSEDLRSGMVDRYKSLPMARSAVIAGRILADTMRNGFVVALMIGVGTAIGFRFHGGLGGALAMPFLAVATGIAFSWISAFIGVSVKNTESAQVAGFLWIFPLTFMSSAFVPVETMPGWLQGFANINPVTVTVNAARGMAQGGEVGTYLWQSLAWTAAILAVFVPLAVTKYRRV
ncbi:MAG: ABC transporter permease [Dehalococcoidia bacterium]